jgi:hypothetical protein
MCVVTVQQRVNNEHQTRLPVFRLEKDPRIQGVEKIPPFLYMGFISTNKVHSTVRFCQEIGSTYYLYFHLTSTV